MGPDVEVLPLLVDLADDAPDGQVVQVHLVPVVVLHRVQEGLQHPRVQVGLKKKDNKRQGALISKNLAICGLGSVHSKLDGKTRELKLSALKDYK